MTKDEDISLANAIMRVGCVWAAAVKFVICD